MTSHAAIEQAAFELFAAHGFEATTLEAIAREVGVSRRTLFRYYRSKNDIPWGQFDRTLAGFRELLASVPSDVTLFQAVCRAVVQFNDFPDDASPSHRDRMRLILGTPTLTAHSVIRYAEWRQVISEHAASQLGVSVNDLVPQLVGQVSLAVALTSYERWLRYPDRALKDLIEEGMSALQDYVRGAGDT